VSLVLPPPPRHVAAALHPLGGGGGGGGGGASSSSSAAAAAGGASSLFATRALMSSIIAFAPGDVCALLAYRTPRVGVALFAIFGPELGLWVGTFRDISPELGLWVGTFHVILHSKHIQLMTPSVTILDTPETLNPKP
jgi:hypothetical protein